MTEQSTGHYRRSIEYIDAVKAAATALREEYKRPHERRASLIADLHTEIGRGLKLAEIEATLAVVDELRGLKAVLAIGGLDEPVPYHPSQEAAPPGIPQPRRGGLRMIRDEEDPS